jgi:hypothetical protein
LRQIKDEHPSGYMVGAMKRFLAILFALLIPLQSGMGAIVPITGMGARGCEQSVALAAHQGDPGALLADPSDCECAIVSHGGAHGIVDDHACPHLGMATVAVAPATNQTFSAGHTAPTAKHASFDSIVLDVPSPPPTRLA